MAKGKITNMGEKTKLCTGAKIERGYQQEDEGTMDSLDREKRREKERKSDYDGVCCGARMYK